jgi:hypothetical protein
MVTVRHCTGERAGIFSVETDGYRWSEVFHAIARFLDEHPRLEFVNSVNLSVGDTGLNATFVASDISPGDNYAHHTYYVG